MDIFNVLFIILWLYFDRIFIEFYVRQCSSDLHRDHIFQYHILIIVVMVMYASVKDDTLLPQVAHHILPASERLGWSLRVGESVIKWVEACKQTGCLRETA